MLFAAGAADVAVAALLIRGAVNAIALTVYC